MRAIVLSEPPRLPRVEAFLEGTPEKDALHLMGGTELPMALIGDIACRLSTEQYDEFCDAADELGVQVEDMRCKRLAHAALSVNSQFLAPEAYQKLQTQTVQ